MIIPITTTIRSSARLKTSCRHPHKDVLVTRRNYYKLLTTQPQYKCNLICLLVQWDRKSSFSDPFISRPNSKKPQSQTYCVRLQNVVDARWSRRSRRIVVSHLAVSLLIDIIHCRALAHTKKGMNLFMLFRHVFPSYATKVSLLAQ